MSLLLTSGVTGLVCLVAGLLLRPPFERLVRRKPSLRDLRRELDGPRPGLAFYVVPPGLGDPAEIVAGLTGNRRPRLCLIGRFCGPLPYDAAPVAGSVLRRGALWVAAGMLIFDPKADGAEMCVLEAPYGVDALEPMPTDTGDPMVTLDLGDGVVVFEPSPDIDVSHAWSRIESVLTADQSSS
ncbi:hypothetical protein [Actinomadura alba]|uniref:Secreted protein n=1 Tax=Actinomadura alba TaxID=406431 RepID=A0ABR7LMC8_9ACTN|nr:hypothetical protein [Actinomadura alba]MBC6465911.1 hypothetical protein [Actinomadura alba]